MNRIAGTVVILPLIALAACSGTAPATPEQAKQAERAAAAQMSRPDSRLPDGITIFVGANGAQALEIAPAGQGQITTFSVSEAPARVRDFYERQATDNGMEVIGRVTASDLASVDARNQAQGANPRTFSVMAVDKGPLTNVTIMINVT
jgi:hypothetical protein